MTLDLLVSGIEKLIRFNLGNVPDFGDKQTKEDWFMALKHISDADFIRSINIIARTFRFFPTVADIIAAAIPENILSGDEEWECVEFQIKRCCGAPGVLPEKMNPVTCRVVASMGGLNEIWTDDRDRSFVRAEFVKKYNKIVSSESMRFMSGDGVVKKLEVKNDINNT